MQNVSNILIYHLHTKPVNYKMIYLQISSQFL